MARPSFRPSCGSISPLISCTITFSKFPVTLMPTKDICGKMLGAGNTLATYFYPTPGVTTTT